MQQSATEQIAGPLTPGVSKKLRWISWILSIIPILMLVMSAVMKFLQPPEVVEGFKHLGWSQSLAFALGILELICTAIYIVPRTAILGAVLLTGYFGGATATTLRVGDSYIFTVLLGVLVWGGLYLREPRLRALLPIVK
jgi:hypothetical protein